MITEVGEVRAVAGPYATVAANRKSTCSACKLSKGCGIALIGTYVGRPIATIRALNLAGADVGDRVEVAVDDHQLLRWSIAVYIIPLLCMIGSAVIAQEFFQCADAMTALSGFSGLAAGFILSRYLVSANRPDTSSKPIVHRRLSSALSRFETEHPLSLGRL